MCVCVCACGFGLGGGGGWREEGRHGTGYKRGGGGAGYRGREEDMVLDIILDDYLP